MKAELCPVCHGRGKVSKPAGYEGYHEVTCHGCGGTGWVTVPEDHHIIFPEVKDKNKIRL